ncbi:MAG TPA: hypothetical protein VF189_01750 [Patescibacteria group bacterium]
MEHEHHHKKDLKGKRNEAREVLGAGLIIGRIVGFIICPGDDIAAVALSAITPLTAQAHTAQIHEGVLPKPIKIYQEINGAEIDLEGLVKGK